MEIRRWLFIILIKCIVIQYIGAKSVSLNEIIAAESQEKQVAKVPSKLRFADSRATPVSSDNIITAESQHKLLRKHSPSRKIKDLLKRSPLTKRLASHANIRKFKTVIKNTFTGDKILSPLKYRKTFQIRSPLKPKKLKLTLKSRQKRKNQSSKREISGNEGLKHKYIPLLKSLSMLFDNLINTDDSDSDEIKRKKYKRNRYYSGEQFEPSFERSSISDAKITKSRSQKKTTTPPPSFSTEVSSNTEGLTDHQNNDYSTLRPYKSVPVLLPRNTVSLRRDNYGPSQRSSATHNGDPEGDITRDHGDYEYDTRNTKNESGAKSDENDTYSVTRNDSSGIGQSRRRGNGSNTRNSKNRKTSVTSSTLENENNDVATGAVQFEIRRNKTESEDSIREPIRRLRGSVFEDKSVQDERLISELIHPKEVLQENVFNATIDSTGDKRITNENGPFTTEDEKIRPGNETVISIARNSRHAGNNSKSVGKKHPVVLIFDGYSVTRDKNGENKVSGKTIHIRH